MPIPPTIVPLVDLPLDAMDATLLTLALLNAPASNPDLLPDAIRVAAHVHQADFRPTRPPQDREPYIAHPLRNTLRLSRYGCRDVAVLAATVLHDTVEDHTCELVALTGAAPAPAGARQQALAALAEWFGPDVARIVAAVSNPPSPPGLDAGTKRARYRAHVEEKIADPQVLLVKFSDYVDNAGSVDAIEDTARRHSLALKYVPLVPVFVAAIDRNAAALALPADGIAAMRADLDRVAAVLAEPAA